MKRYFCDCVEEIRNHLFATCKITACLLFYLIKNKCNTIYNLNREQVIFGDDLNKQDSKTPTIFKLKT